jgi:transcriptional regulator with XRE-family HTH domain
METLRAYIKEVMRQKDLKGIEIEARSGGKITNSYISDIINGKTKSISVDKVNALAEGLGVDSFEVFTAASGRNVHKEGEPWSGFALIRIMEKVMQSQDLAAIVKIVSELKTAKVKALRKQLEGVEK